MKTIKLILAVIAIMVVSGCNPVNNDVTKILVDTIRNQQTEIEQLKQEIKTLKEGKTIYSITGQEGIYYDGVIDLDTKTLEFIPDSNITSPYIPGTNTIIRHDIAN